MTSIALQDKSILMLAPSRVLAAVLQKELGDIGAVQTVSCKSIGEALQKMRDIKPDIVVSSMYFEDGDGVDLVTAMRHDEALKDTLFMLISSETRFEMLAPVRQAGVVAILSRPFTQEALTRAVNSALDCQNGKSSGIDYQKLVSLKLLLIDESKSARRHMLNVLEKIGITPLQITQAEQSGEAMEKLQSEKFDLVLTDYNMSQTSGEDLLKYIAQHPELDGVPVIFVESEENKATLASIKNYGVTAMINKPFDPANLKTLLENHL